MKRLIKQNSCIMADFLKGLVEVRNTNGRVSDSATAVRRKRILDAKRRMVENRTNDGASSVNRVSDSARPASRGIAANRASAVQRLTKKQDSQSKSYFRLRNRIKDELAETETTDEVIESAISVLEEEVDNNPEAVLNAAEDIIAAVVEAVAEFVPDDMGGDEDETPAIEEGGEDEVSDSLKRQVVRRRGVADARKLAMIRRRVKDGLARRAVATRRSSVKDSTARSRALAAARRVRDARAKRDVVRPSVRRTSDSRKPMERRVVRRG